MRTRLLRSICLFAAALPAFGCAATSAAPEMYLQPASTNAPSLVRFPEFPSLSPDGRKVVFAWAGDLWAAPTAGGPSIRLTAHPATERRSAFSPDGSLLAFESDRDGSRSLYVMSLDRAAETLVPGPIWRITGGDRAQSLGGWSADGRSLYFSGTQEPELHRSPRMYKVDLERTGEGWAGGPIRELTRAFGGMPRATRDGGVLFYRGRYDPDRPKYHGSGSLDIYRMSLSDNTFRRLTAHPNNDFDGWPVFDGSTLFVSSRDGQNNLWKLPAGAAEPSAKPVQITRYAPTAEEYTIAHGVRDLTVSGDGRTAVFGLWDGLYSLDLTAAGATPTRIDIHVGSDTQSLDWQRITVSNQVSEAALSPDGKTMAIVARGEVFIRPTTEGRPTRRVTTSYGRERDLAWSPCGTTLYFASDEPTEGAALGAYSLWTATVALAREDVRPIGGAAREEPAEGRRAEARRDDKPDPGKRWAEAVTFEVRPMLAGPDDLRRPNPSPDGKRLIYTRGRGDVMLRDLSGDTAGAERVLIRNWDSGVEILWAGDSRHVVYAVNDLDFNTDIWLLDTGAADARAINLTQHPDNDYSPRLSADGKVLTFLSQRGSGDDSVDVYQIYLDRELEGMTAYERDEYFKKATEAAGKRKPLELKKPEAPQVEKKDEGAAEAAADAGAAEDKKPDEKPAPPAKAEEPKPLKFDAEDAYLRIRRVTSTRGSTGNLAMTPGGDRIIFTAPADDGPSTLVSIDHKGGDRKTIAPGPLGGVDVSLTGDRVVFVKSGAANTAPKAGGRVDTWAIDAQIEVEMARQQRQKFLEAARVVGQNFYHNTLKGLDWDRLTHRYLQLAERTRTSDSFNRIVNMLFGELDGSHLGISGGSAIDGWSAPSAATGYLGIRAEPAPGGFRVVGVTPKGPADSAHSRLNIGDVLLSADGKRFAAGDDAVPAVHIDEFFRGTTGRETLLEIAGADGARRMVLIVPISWGQWDSLRYSEIVQQRREMVERLSGGRLGYLHIRGMSEPSVREFERDLYAAGKDKEGLIIDVRDNGGGWTADILLSSLTAPRHAKTQPRGVDPSDVPEDAYPRDRRLIYAWTRPINVLINQNSFSNAEIFAHAVKTARRGRLIGTATFGGVISTGGTTLIDGTSVRLPFRGWYLPDGTDQENNGARPDVDVPQTPEDEANDRDRQLEAAVEDLLKQLRR